MPRRGKGSEGSAGHPVVSSSLHGMNLYLWEIAVSTSIFRAPCQEQMSPRLWSLSPLLMYETMRIVQANN
jgi:hypothetical protein